jgi:hypothetical protein
LAGRVTEHHRFMLRFHSGHNEQGEQLVEQLNGRIGEKWSVLWKPVSCWERFRKRPVNR